MLAAVFAALVAVFGKVGIEGIDTMAATAIRAVVMAVLLVVVTVALGKAGRCDMSRVGHSPAASAISTGTAASLANASCRTGGTSPLR